MIYSPGQNWWIYSRYKRCISDQVSLQQSQQGQPTSHALCSPSSLYSLSALLLAIILYAVLTPFSYRLQHAQASYEFLTVLGVVVSLSAVFCLGAAYNFRVLKSKIFSIRILTSFSLLNKFFLLYLFQTQSRTYFARLQKPDQNDYKMPSEHGEFADPK